MSRLKLSSACTRGPQRATLKVYRGVPKLLVMLATGHQTEAQFNVYLGIDEPEMLDSRRTDGALPPQIRLKMGA